MAWFSSMGPTGPEKRPESAQDQSKATWDVDVVTTTDDENNPWVVITEEFVLATFRDWVKDAGLHESREKDILYGSVESPKGKLQGSERRRVIRAGNIALGEAYR